ncbi:MAG: hypothetical protein JWO74_734 [Solirubrobacterales bacterium]|nr:hypothetical protein [Solirubrobacterales bacterium]
MAASSRGSLSDHARTPLATAAGILAGCALIGVSIVGLDDAVLRFEGWPVEHRARATGPVALPSPGAPSRGSGVSALLGSRPVLPAVTSAGELRAAAAVRPVLRPVVPRSGSRKLQTHGHQGTSTSTRPSRPAPVSPAPTPPVGTPAPVASPAPGTSPTTNVVAAASPSPAPAGGDETLSRTSTARLGRGAHGKGRGPEPAKQAPGPPASPPPMSADPVVAASDPSPPPGHGGTPPGQGGTPPGQLKKDAGDAGHSGERRGQRKR